MARVWKFGNNINTDQIIPGRYYPRENYEELGDFCLCELNPDFAKSKEEGDIIIAGKNFGCGSSREFAAIALKHSKIKCVIAESFARIFYRNCINIGYPILVCEGLFENTSDGDIISVDLKSGMVSVKNKIYYADPLPEFVLRIKKAGGIINLIKKIGIKGLEESAL